MDVSQYLEIFIDETSEHLQNLSDCIMELEKDPENMDTINEIFRAAHSLKGMAGTMGFKRMQRLTHDMENVFQEVRSEKVKVTSSMIDLLFKCLDAIEGYLDNVKASSDEGTEDNELIIKELNDFIAAEDGAAAAPAQEQPQAQAAKPAAKTQSSGNKKQTVAKPVTNRTVRVDIEKLDALMNQVSELIIAKNSLVSISSTDSGDFQNQSFHEQIEYLERITTNLHESVMKVRMVPIESVVAKFPRMIRDLSRKLDKKMELYMTGEDTELDRTVVDQIGDPLQHLLRNSADHGLEDNATRIAKGKPEVGSIFLNAFQEGNNVIIQVGDDGNGIDVEAVRNKAIERGVITEEQAETMSQKEIINLLFLPSFSMAKKITDISGRGVGLDVVKSNIEALGGDVEVKTELGVGTTFTVRLPLTLAIIQALMVEIRDEKYAIALGSISNIEDIPVKDIKYVEAQEVIHLRGKVIPLIRMDQVLDIEPKEEEPESLTVVIVQQQDHQRRNDPWRW